MRIVVVGGVAAGMSAASRARRENPAAEVVVFERGQTVSYGACGLPYVIGGMVEKNGETGFGALVARTPEQLRGQGIGVRLGHEVTGIDAAARTVTVQDHARGRVLHEPYDELLIATGVRASRPDFMPDLNGDGLAGLHVLRDIPDGEAIQATLAGGARRAIIVGGGYIGLELAEALHARGLSVAVLEAGPAVAGRMLDTAGQQRVRQELEANGVEVRCGVTVEALTSKDGRVTGVVTDAGRLRGDLVVVAVGVRPNTELAVAAGVRLGKTGAVRVDARQQTSVPGLWAAGDVCESLHRVTRRRVHIPLGLHANRMGRVAGVNMAGGEARFPGLVGSAIFKVFGLSAARTGLTQKDCDELGLKAVSVDVVSSDHAGYYRDHHPILVRLTGELGTGRLLGAQLLGHGDSVKRVDVIAALLHGRGRVDQLAEMDLAYAPPFASVWDVLLVAAGKLLGAVRG